ncbi:ArsA-related P-loop ATPase [Microlunatus sp. Y2014]|uniref:ArsA-related P-loop ATPase n=1 Tax=Microlunatus sp. Y2014 TaxID=3418488 RepID=UPI003DA7854D
MRGPRHTLHVVSGKGGTGKTTVAAALACALATRGRRVLLCEVEGRQGISGLFGRPALRGAEEPRLLRTPAGGQVHGLSIDAEDALLEYLATFYRMGLAARVLDKFGAIDFATSIAPGLSDVLLTGKVYEAVRRGEKRRPNAYDAVVLDAPPTGRVTRFLNVHDAVSGLAKVGPIRKQADSIMNMLRSDRTVVHLVTLPEEMPVTETVETVSELNPTGITVGTVIANQTTTTPLPHDQLVAAREGRLTLDIPALDRADLAALQQEFGDQASRILDEEDALDRLKNLHVPTVRLPREPYDIDETTVWSLAQRLAEQLPEEVAT